MDYFDNENERTDYKDTAIWQKAMDIAVLAHKIAELIDVDNDKEGLLTVSKEMFIESAVIIPAKIAGASSPMIFYDLKMENAAIVRKNARDLMTSCTSLKAYGFEEGEYLNMLREEIEEFRLLFIEWVKTFDDAEYIADRWGLFNPPGVGPDDDDDF